MEYKRCLRAVSSCFKKVNSCDEALESELLRGDGRVGKATKGDVKAMRCQNLSELCDNVKET